MSGKVPVSRPGLTPIVAVSAVLVAVIWASAIRRPDLAPLLAPLIYLCVITLSLLVMVRVIRSTPPNSSLLAREPVRHSESGGGPLQAGEILSLEFQYARETAGQAMGDRQALVNFYLAIAGALPTAVAILLSQGMPVERLKDFRGFGVWALSALVIIGWLFFLKMIRLREAHADSLRAMNAIKDFYLGHTGDLDHADLAQAFVWRTATMPRLNKKWNVFFLSAGLIAFLNSLTFAVGVLILADIGSLVWRDGSPISAFAGTGRDQVVPWAAFGLYGLLMLGLHLSAYSTLLAPKGERARLSPSDSKPARPSRRVEVLEQGREYDGYFKIDRVRLRFERFDGRLSEPITRQVIERGDSVCVLLYDPTGDAVLLIQQFRYPAYVRNGPGWLWEIVAGMQDKGRDRVSVAHAELVEEAGYRVEHLAPITQFYPSPGGLSERMYLYLGYISPADRVSPGGGLPSETEDIRVALFSLPDALSMVESGEVCDAKTIVALQWLALHHNSLPRYVKS